jgi:hypothetical protein
MAQINELYGRNLYPSHLTLSGAQVAKQPASLMSNVGISSNNALAEVNDHGRREGTGLCSDLEITGSMCVTQQTPKASAALAGTTPCAMGAVARRHPRQHPNFNVDLYQLLLLLSIQHRS